MAECSFNPKKISALIISYLPAMKQKKRPKLVKKVCMISKIDVIKVFSTRNIYFENQSIFSDFFFQITRFLPRYNIVHSFSTISSQQLNTPAFR